MTRGFIPQPTTQQPHPGSHISFVKSRVLEAMPAMILSGLGYWGTTPPESWGCSSGYTSPSHRELELQGSGGQYCKWGIIMYFKHMVRRYIFLKKKTEDD